MKKNPTRVGFFGGLWDWESLGFSGDAYLRGGLR